MDYNNLNEDVKITIDIDVEKAQKDLDKLTKTIEDLNKSTDVNEDYVKELEKQWTKLDNAIKNSVTGQRNLSKELKEVTKQLQVMKLNGQENTVEYAKLIKTAGELKDAISDTQQAINKTASDTANLDAILGAASAASGGFGLLTSAMSILGADTKNVEKWQKKLIEAITLVNSVQQISNALNRDGALMVKLHAVAHKLFAKQMQATATATNAAAKSMTKFKAALVSSGIGALVVILGGIVAKMIEWNEKQEQTEESAQRLVSSYKQANVALENMNNSLNATISLYQKWGASQKAIDALQFQSLKNQKTIVDNNLKAAESEITAIRKKGKLQNEDYERIKELETEIGKLRIEQANLNKEFSIEEAMNKQKSGWLDASIKAYEYNIKLSEKKIKQDNRDLQLLEQQNEAYKFQNNTEDNMTGFLEKKQQLQEDIVEQQKLIAQENINSINDQTEAFSRAIDNISTSILSSTEKNDLKEGHKRLAEEQVKAFKTQIDDLGEELKDIQTAADIERLKTAKASANATRENLIAQQQAEVKAAQMVADQKRKIFEQYSADEGADLEKLLEYREDYVNALTDLNEKEKKILQSQQRNDEANVRGNAAKLKVVTSNYANANKELATSFDETMKAINETTQAAFMIKEAQIQETLDLISGYIDEIDAKTQDLKVENAGITKNLRGFDNAFSTRQDPEYEMEKASIDKRRELYKSLYEGKVEYAITYSELIKSLNNEELALEQQNALKREEAWKNAASQLTGYLGSSLASIAEMQDTSSKQGFETAKKLQYASTVVNTLSAMMGAYNSMINIPYVGVALATAAMATAAATGAAQIAAIKRQKYESPNSITPTTSANGNTPRMTAGTSNVTTAILSRGIQTTEQPKTEYVAIVDEITYKQNQQTNIQKVSVI